MKNRLFASLLFLTCTAVYSHETEKTQQANIPLWERIKNNPIKSNLGPLCTIAGFGLSYWAIGKVRDARTRGIERGISESNISVIQREPRRNQFIGLTVAAIGLFLVHQVYADKNDPKLSTKESEQKS